MSKEAALAAAATAIGVTPPAAAPVATATPSAPATGDVPASLAKKEAEIVRRQQEFKKQQADFDIKNKRADEILKIGEEFNTLRTTDPVAALRKLGFTETEIFNFLAASEKKELTSEEKAVAAAEAAADAKIKAFEDGQTKKAQDEQERRDQQTLTSFKTSITAVIKADPVKFEYCAYEGASAEALIYETVLQSVAQSAGKDAITALEAAELVESYYEEKDKGMSALKKRTPASPTVESNTKTERTRTPDPTSPGAATAKPTVTRTRTITNKATATVASTTAKRPETPGEKRARLENLLRNGGKVA